MKSKRGLLRLAGVAAAVAAVACSGKPAADAGQGEAAAAVAAAPTIPVVDVVARDYAFEAPDTFPAGVVKIRISEQGKEIHHVTMIRLDDGKTVADLGAAVKGIMAGGAPPAWMVPVGGPNAVVPGQTFEADVELTPGNYAMVCLIPSPDGQPHAAKGMVKPITVAGPAAVDSLPPADITIKLVDYGFQMSTPLTAGHHVIRLTTDASQMHEMLLARLNDGKTALELAKWAEHAVGPPPGMPLGGVTALAPGHTNQIEVNLEPGEYALICFMPDIKDGKPHYEHGMIQQIKIS